MSSGVAVSADCMTEYTNLKMNKMYRFVVFKLNDAHTEIVVDQKGARTTTYQDFVDHLSAAAKSGECRFAVYDVDFKFNDQPKNKLIFVAWSPEGAKIKQKMVYSSSKSVLKKKLQIDLELQATDLEELSFASVVERCSRTLKD